jgi:Arc/MetJ-type ribon-helix-helix transcriptional regulator
MKTMTVRLPLSLVAEIEAESRVRRISKSDVIRERLQRGRKSSRRPSTAVEGIADLIGSVEGLPADLSARKKWYLKATGYGKKRTR